MVAERQESMAQFVDRFLQRITLGVFVLAFSYAVGVAKYFAGEEMLVALDMVKTGLALLGAAITLPSFIKFVRMKKKCGSSFAEPSGYIVEVYRKACEYAFAFTFVLLILLEPVAVEFLVDVPAALYIHVTLTVSLLSLSLSFFFMSRGGDDELDDDFGGENV
ncbi:MAG: hypothetical protein AB3N28_06580 [Kordiimonas sp.]